MRWLERLRYAALAVACLIALGWLGRELLVGFHHVSEGRPAYRLVAALLGPGVSLALIMALPPYRQFGVWRRLVVGLTATFSGLVMGVTLPLIPFHLGTGVVLNRCVAVPMKEEIVKIAIAIFLAWLVGPVFRSRWRLVVVALATGAAFAGYENLQQLGYHGWQAGVALETGTLIARHTSIADHALTTALIAAFIVRFRGTTGPRVVAWGLIGVALAVALHAFHNGLSLFDWSVFPSTRVAGWTLMVVLWSKVTLCVVAISSLIRPLRRSTVRPPSEIRSPPTENRST